MIEIITEGIECCDGSSINRLKIVIASTRKRNVERETSLNEYAINKILCGFI